MHEKKQLFEELRRLGVQPGDAVLMHSSFRSLGGVEGGAAGLFDVLADAVGDGTLILPALSYYWVSAEQTVFDLRDTPACPGIGYLPEYFRTQVPGVRRSLHPTHSCCMLGRDAEWLAAGHDLDDTPVGRHSPFAKLPALDGWILMLGCSPDRNTSMHGVEETAEPDYLLDRAHPIRYTLRDERGEPRDHWAIPHSFHRDGFRFEQRYGRILPLLQGDELRRGRVGDADCVMMRARAVWERGRQALHRDPHFFVDRVPDGAETC